MYLLNYKNAGDELVQFFGPSRYHNHYEFTVTPAVEIQVFGAGSVDLFQTDQFDYASMYPNPVFSTKIFDFSAAPIIVTVNAASGLVTQTLTVYNHDNAISLRVNTPGDGRVLIKSLWR